MPRARNLTTEKKVRGVYEKIPGSGEWWVRWTDSEGKLRRQKAGSKATALAAYKKHKNEAREGKIVPVLRNAKRATLNDLIDLVLAHTVEHKSHRDYQVKAGIIRSELGNRPAAEIKPAEIDEWLSSRGRSAATGNRYKAFLSLCYKLGMANGKVKENPARMVRQRRENGARLRFLSREEYDKLCEVIQRRCPEHLPEFIVSVHSGMRLSEQYSCQWSQVDLQRGTIRLSDTKNGSARTVYLAPDALAAIKSLKASGQRPSDLVFDPSWSRNDTRGWFLPCLAEAEITGYVWHGNRHTFCSWLAMKGASIKDIQELAGHKTVAISARYAHLSPDHKRSVLDRLAEHSEGVN
jgi:integrase